ncbi:MAG: universal stress protein [Mycobacteriales bacterium]
MAEIVVGIDDSVAASRALEWAVDEAAQRGARLRVVHAWRKPQLNTPLGVAYPMMVNSAALKADAERVADDALRRALVGRHDSAAIESVAQAIEGEPAQLLVDLSKTADLVVVGSRGAGGFARLLMGSVSTQVVHHAHCPVAVVPEASTRPA